MSSVVVRLSSHVGVFMYVCMILPFVCYVMYPFRIIDAEIRIGELEQVKYESGFIVNYYLRRYDGWLPGWLVMDDTVQGSLISVQWGFDIPMTLSI